MVWWGHQSQTQDASSSPPADRVDCFTLARRDLARRLEVPDTTDTVAVQQMMPCQPDLHLQTTSGFLVLSFGF